MATGHEHTTHRGSRRHNRLLRRTPFGIVVALAAMGLAAIPASAASQDGTSNTIQFSVASAVLDQAHHRVIVTSPAPKGLTVGRHLATVEVATSRYSGWILTDVLVESYAGTTSSLTLNFTKIDVDAFGRAPCMSGADACLIEEDGTYPPAP
jgi:hypothetical protein